MPGTDCGSTSFTGDCGFVPLGGGWLANGMGGVPGTGGLSLLVSFTVDGTSAPK